MNNARTGLRFFTILAGLIGLLAMPAGAAIIHVSMDTSSQSGVPALMFFDLVDGDGVDNNTATISLFNDGGGTLGAANPSAGVSGSLPGVVTISNVSAFESLEQGITLGSLVSFDVHVTENHAGGPFDSFAFSIFDDQALGTLFPSTDPLGALLLVTILDGAVSVEPFSDLIAFQVEPDPTPTPAPGSFPLALLGALLLVASRRMPLAAARR